MHPKLPSDFTFHAAMDRRRVKTTAIDGNIPDRTIFLGIYLVLVMLAVAVGSPDPSGLDLSP